MAPDVAASLAEARQRKAAKGLAAKSRKADKSKVQVRTGRITTNADGSARVPLRPSEAQQQLLDALFGGPLFLQQLISQSAEPIPDRAAASLFLLKHHRELSAHLFEENRALAVDWLTGLVQQWSACPPQEIALEMPGTISGEQDIHLSMRQIGGLAPKDKLALERLRHKRRYAGDFVLVRLDGKYYVDISFQTVSATTNAAPHRPQQNARSPRKRALPLGAFLAMFNSALNSRLRAELRVSQQYSRTQFEKLEGWGVNGGLPSLGKGR